MVNWIHVRSLLDTASIYRFPIRSIDFVLVFSQGDLDVDVFMEVPLGIAVGGNTG